MFIVRFEGIMLHYTTNLLSVSVILHFLLYI